MKEVHFFKTSGNDYRVAKLECLGWNLRPVELVKIYNMGSNANLILPLQVFALPIVSVEQIKTVSRGVCCNLMHVFMYVVMLTSRGAQVSAGILRDMRNWGTRWRSWLRHCATSRKVAGSIPDGVTRIFH